MQTKLIEKEKVIALRRQGKTYSEIRKVVHVAKSTVTLWLQEVGLSKKQKQNITAKRIAGALRGAMARKNDRIRRQTEIINTAILDIKSISKRELFLIGVILYWAEGGKGKEWRPSQRLAFSNMDPRMVRLFLRWLIEIAKIPRDMIGFEVTLHETHAFRVLECREYWVGVTGFPLSVLNKVYYKKAKIMTKRRNIGEQYFGILRVTVRESTTLVRKIAGWTEGIVQATE